MKPDDLENHFDEYAEDMAGGYDIAGMMKREFIINFVLASVSGNGSHAGVVEIADAIWIQINEAAPLNE